MKNSLFILFAIAIVSCSTTNTSQTEEVLSLNGYWKFNAISGEGSNFLDKKPEPKDILIDNKQTEFLEIKGIWQHTSEGDRTSFCWGEGYLKRTFKVENESAYVRFKAAVPEHGYYEHLIFYPWANHNAAIVNVKHADGVFSSYFNMRNRTNVWLSLGVFRVEKGSDNYIEFTSPTKGGVVADAVIYRPVSAEQYSASQKEKKDLLEPDYDDSGWPTLKVPGHWGMINEYANYSGKGWYRTEIKLPNNWEDVKDERTRLRFEGIYHVANVYLNGKYLGQHQGGFTPFEFDVSDKLNYSGKNSLVVEADNRNTVGATWNWGGIIRDVTLIRNKDVRIKFQYIHAEPDLKQGTADYKIKVRVENNSSVERNLKVKAEIIKEKSLTFSSTQITVAPNSIKEFELQGKLSANQVKLWHFDRPELYHLETAITEGGKRLHKKTDRFGIRKVEATETQLLLNGEPVRLVGFNRVSDHRYWGSSEPLELLKLDVDLMKTAGASFTRIMHGTQNKKLLELCDEKGIMVFEEANIRDLRNPQFVAPDYTVPKQWIREMIERDINHPCIVGWSIGNELKDHFEYVKMTYEYAKELDPYRMALHVSNQGYRKGEDSTSNPLNYGDMIFQNIYQKDPGMVMDILHARWPNKAMFFSEFGWAELSRFTNANLDNDFKELEKWYAHLRDQRPYTVGASIWTFNDYRSGYTQSLPSENRAWGMVNAWRTKRRLFYTHQKENSPVKDLKVENIDLIQGNASVSMHIRNAKDFPSFTMKGYSLRYTFRDITGKLLLENVMELPVLSPGMGKWNGDISWKQLDEKAFVLHVELVTANGYTRSETKIYLDVPEKPEIIEIKASDNRMRVHFAKDFGAFEYYAKYKIGGKEAVSYKTIANYIDLDDLPIETTIQLQLIACNTKGESQPSEPISVKTKGQALAPIIWDGFIADNKLVVGYSGDLENDQYTVQYGISKEHLNRTVSTNTRGMMTAPLNGEKTIFFQIKRVSKKGESQWSNIVEAQEGKFRIYR